MQEFFLFFPKGEWKRENTANIKKNKNKQKIGKIEKSNFDCLRCFLLIIIKIIIIITNYNYNKITFIDFK